MKKSLVLELICGLLITLFTYTALSKLFILAQFRIDLSYVPGIKNIAQYLAVFIPVSELVISSGLIFHTTRRLALAASIVLLTAFTIYIIFLVLFVPDKPCSCGGVLSSLSWEQHIVFNVAFLIMGIIAYRMSPATLPRRFLLQ